MTIVEAIIEVMNDFPDGMTDKDVYSTIVFKKLYKFGARDPFSVVRGKIRSHCLGLDFPSASNHKYFTIIKTVGKTNYYGLISKKYESAKINHQNTDPSEMLPEEKNNSSLY